MTAKMLIDEGADVHLTWMGRTPLQQVLINFDLDVGDDPERYEGCLRVLISAGARVPDRNLLDACWNAGFLRILLDAGADVDHQDEHGSTALMRVCKRKCVESVRILLEAGANTDLMDTGGRSAWYYALPKLKVGLREDRDRWWNAVSRSHAVFELMRNAADPSRRAQ